MWYSSLNESSCKALLPNTSADPAAAANKCSQTRHRRLRYPKRESGGYLFVLCMRAIRILAARRSWFEIMQDRDGLVISVAICHASKEHMEYRHTAANNSSIEFDDSMQGLANMHLND